MPYSKYRFITKLQIFFLLVWLQGAPLEAGSSSYDYEIAKPRCPGKCGNISIPYPFGFGDESCYLNQTNFRVTCNESFNPPKPHMDTFDLYDIDLIRGEVLAGFSVGHDCSNRDGTQSDVATLPQVSSGSFTFSPTRNKFFGVGCDIYTYYESSSYKAGCMSF